MTTEDGTWTFTMYVAGDTPLSEATRENLRRLCERHVPGRYRIETVDILDTSVELPPNILAIPTVVRSSPRPERRVIGDLSSWDIAARGLGLDEQEAEPPSQ